MTASSLHSLGSLLLGHDDGRTVRLTDRGPIGKRQGALHIAEQICGAQIDSASSRKDSTKAAKNGISKYRKYFLSLGTEI